MAEDQDQADCEQKVEQEAFRIDYPTGIPTVSRNLLDRLV